MKLRRFAAIIMAAALCLLAGCTDTGNDAQTGADGSSEATVIRVGVSGDFYPFCYKENDQLKGFEIDLWEHIAEENGWELEYVVSDLTGLFGMLDTDKVDVVAREVSSDNPTRQEKYLFSDVYLYCTYNLVTKADSPLNTLEDFKGTRIGVVMGGDGELNLKKLNEEQNLGIEIVGYESTSTMDSDIELGRIDGRVAPMLQTKKNIEEKGQNFKITDNIVYLEQAAYPFQKEDTALADAVNKILQEMRDSGELSALSEEWFGVDATVPPQQ